MLGIGNFSLWITTPFPNPMKGLVGTPSGIGLDNQLEWVVFRNLVHFAVVFGRSGSLSISEMLTASFRGPL